MLFTFKFRGRRRTVHTENVVMISRHHTRIDGITYNNDSIEYIIKTKERD